MQKLVVFGTGKISEEVYYYLKNDSDYDVVAFCEDKKYRNKESFFDKPVVDFEVVQQQFSPIDNDMMVVMGYQDLNRIRAEKYLEAKQMGYSIGNYISSKVSNIGKIAVGENTIVLDGAVLQATSVIGNNTIVWNGNHIGHHARVEDHNYISGQVMIGGGTTIKSFCFFGMHATIGHEITIEKENFIGAHSLITQSTKPQDVYIANSTPKYRLNSKQMLQILDF